MGYIIENCRIIFTNILRFGAFEKREFVVNPEKKVIYLNNPKVACTSLKTSLFEYNYNQSIDDDSVHAVLRSHYIFNLDRKILKKYFIYTYVRNPFTRLVSCYKNKVYGNRRKFGEYLFGILKEDHGFEDFAGKVIRIPDFLADQHFKSQYSFIYQNHKCLADFVGKMETMEKSYAEIQKKYELGELKHYNVTADDNWMDYYTVPLAKKVYRRYRKDFIKFGYKEEYTKLVKYLKGKNSKQ